MGDGSSFKDRFQGFRRKAEERARGLAERASSTFREIKEGPYFDRAAETSQRAADEMRAWSAWVRESEVVQKAKDRISASPWAVETARAADRIRDTATWKQLENAAERAAEGAREVGRGASERFQRVQNDAETLLVAIERATRDPSDRPLVLSGAADAFERVGPHFDLLANAFSVGTLQEAGAGVASLQGTELVFVPPDGPVRAQLRVSRLVGQAARLAVGGQVGAFAASFYGERDLLVRSLDRRGADLGIIALSLGFFQAAGDQGPRRASGWLVELMAGVALGIPLISDLSTFEIEELPQATYALSAEEAEPFETALAQAPDRPLRRRIARMLARGDAETKPG